MICERLNNCKEKLTKAKDTFKDSKGCRSKYSIENKKEQLYYKIDFENCVYKNRQNDTKCDYGLITNESTYYIELKGSDVKKGISQLLATIRETENCIERKQKKARLIISKFQKPNIVRQRKDYIDLVKLTKQNLIIKENIYTEVI